MKDLGDTRIFEHLLVSLQLLVEGDAVNLFDGRGPRFVQLTIVALELHFFHDLINFSLGQRFDPLRGAQVFDEQLELRARLAARVPESVPAENTTLALFLAEGADHTLAIRPEGNFHTAVGKLRPALASEAFRMRPAGRPLPMDAHGDGV